MTRRPGASGEGDSDRRGCKDSEVVFRNLEDIGKDGLSAVEAVAEDLRTWLDPWRVTPRSRTLEKELVA